MWRAAISRQPAVCSAVLSLQGGSVSRAARRRATTTLARIGAYVENYYGRTQSMLAEQSVTIQPLARDFTADGFARRLVYELRIEWDPEFRLNPQPCIASCSAPRGRCSGRPINPTASIRAACRRSRWPSCCLAAVRSSHSSRRRRIGSTAGPW